MAVLGLRFCARAFSSCGKRGPLLIAVRGPLTIAASLVAEHRLQMRRLSNCGSRAYSLHGMWDLPRPGLEPLSPALVGRFSTTAPPGKPSAALVYKVFSSIMLACGCCLWQMTVGFCVLILYYTFKKFVFQLILVVYPGIQSYWLQIGIILPFLSNSYTSHFFLLSV